ncbi:hypothetical protein FRB99_001568, partial [Tulasnella sp. 403]
MAEHAELTDLVNYLDTRTPNYGVWPILIAEEAIRNMKEFSTTAPQVFSSIKLKIKDLSKGRFTLKKRHAFPMDGDGVPIYKVEVDDFVLICQVDCGVPVRDERGRLFQSQCIRLLAISHNRDIDASFWASASRILGQSGEEYRRRYVESHVLSGALRKQSSSLDAIFACLRLVKLQVADGQRGVDATISENFALRLHRILWAVEDSIIRHKSSCLVIGRSGTGYSIRPSLENGLLNTIYRKTTSMLLRMKALEIGAQKLDHKIRQVFVTHSRKLAEEVERCFKQLSRTSERVEDTLVVATDHQAENTIRGLSDHQLDAEHNSSLPSRFSQLEEQHFPLFLSFDQLCGLLEDDVGIKFQASERDRYQTHRNKSTAASSGDRRGPLITFEKFVSDIWPSFGERIKENLGKVASHRNTPWAHISGLRPLEDPSLLFNEFIGVIKGLEVGSALDPLAEGRTSLDRASYESVCGRGRSMLLNRTQVYALFELYQKRRQPFSYDRADRTRELLNRLMKKEKQGNISLEDHGFDFLYVDEVQDNLLIDIALLRLLCRNPHGLFLAGDTAQTISAGSAFRFDDIKAYLFRLEGADEKVKTGKRKPVDPDTFELSTNYRSHFGILKAAGFIVTLLSQFFPYSVDQFSPEISKVETGRQEDNGLSILAGNKRGGIMTLGAEQVVIVRNKEAYDRATTRYPYIGMIMTLYESKVHIIQVILYNFFADSIATATDWEAIRRALADPSTGTYHRPFDRHRYATLQNELKALYVGLTRSRQHVWIWDSSDDGLDLAELMQSRSLATIWNSDDELPQVGVDSSPEEWENQGRRLFSKGRYPQASFCFQRAGCEWWSRVAATYHGYQLAVVQANGSQRIATFRDVAGEFATLSGSADNSQDRLDLLDHQAKCLVEAGDYNEAAATFCEAEKYGDAVFYFGKIDNYDDALDVIRRHYLSIQADLVKDVQL